MSTRILVYGEVWPGTHAQLISSSANKMGYIGVAFDFYQARLLGRSRNIASRLLRRAFNDLSAQLINKKLRRAIEHVKPTTMIVSKGSELFPETLRFAQRLGIKLINWSPDDYLNPANTSKHLVASLPIYDLLISPRPHRFDIYKKYGAKDALYLDWYYIPELHFPRVGIKDVGLAFVGSWSNDRERSLLDVQTRCTVYGSGWGRRSGARVRRQHLVIDKVLNGEEYASFISRAVFNLNFFTRENFDQSNQRLFEVPACGSVLVSEHSQIVNAVLGPSSCLTFRAPSEIDALITKCTEPEKLAQRGREAILAGKNSFEARFEQLKPHLV